MGNDEKKRRKKVWNSIELAGWAIELARNFTNDSDVSAQLSQAQIDVRQASEALRELDPELPNFMDTGVDIEEKLEETMKNLSK